ncbi:guanylate cyclase soluble subunit beta-2-like [Plakobranchus ocellatus]|uniref:guanylate cyclase n=1 Tax=Plakobranchus ocellatus TaxID=259542 RepID=A0AAV4AGF9_9GAST|nr:guanylate cyclase soluble subunit beta-2-like [Plakobranchus ocellatus]
MITSLYGQDAMDAILRKADLEESKHFKMFTYYPDKVLEELIAATSHCQDLSRQQILEIFGDYFLVHCLRHGYDDMLRTLGCDMEGFLQSLDSLHSLLALTYDNMSAPSFRCEQQGDSTYTLHYHSSRRNYHPLVKGLITAVAREIFYKRVDIEFISSEVEDLGVDRKQEHTIFHLHIYNDEDITALTFPSYSTHWCDEEKDLGTRKHVSNTSYFNNTNGQKNELQSERSKSEAKNSNKSDRLIFLRERGPKLSSHSFPSKQLLSKEDSLPYSPTHYESNEFSKRSLQSRSTMCPFSQISTPNNIEGSKTSTKEQVQSRCDSRSSFHFNNTLDGKSDSYQRHDCTREDKFNSNTEPPSSKAHLVTSENGQDEALNATKDLEKHPYCSELFEEAKKEQTDIVNEDVCLPPVTLTHEQLCTTFPYHLIFDRQLRLRQFGNTVSKLSPVPLCTGRLVTSAFHVVYPRISFTVENILRFINTIYILGVGPSLNRNSDHSPAENGLTMRGQMIWFAEHGLMLFVGSPRLRSLKEMKHMNMYMSDIPLYDVTREMVLLYQQRNAEIDITKRLDETTAELKRTSRNLALEKQRTDRLLYQMLPAKVADQLKLGKKVEAEKFDQVTVLFSDIVEFTSIAAACNPLDVVNMLNSLYHKFDVQTNEHGVYKVTV